MPFDENRLVFPPLPAAVLALIIYQPVHLISSVFADELFNPRLLIAGGLIGYLCYDMIHYYIHYGSPRNQYFYHLKRYHYNHHFVSHDKGFGISSPLWDALFGTRLYLKKLQVILKWWKLLSELFSKPEIKTSFFFHFQHFLFFFCKYFSMFLMLLISCSKSF